MRSTFLAVGNSPSEPKAACTQRVATLRRGLAARQRVTATFKRADRRSLHVRKATQAEPKQQAIFDAIGIAATCDGGTRKMIV